MYENISTECDISVSSMELSLTLNKNVNVYPSYNHYILAT